MTKKLCMVEEITFYQGAEWVTDKIVTEATSAEISEAAGVAELRKRLDQYQTLIDTQQGVIVEQRVKLAEQAEDASVGKAVLERLLECIGIAFEPIWDIDNGVVGCQVLNEEGEKLSEVISDTGYLENSDIVIALRASGLLPVKAAE